MENHRFSRAICIVAAASAVAGIPLISSALPFGICGHIPSDEISDEIVNSRIEWVRVDVVWSLIEPRQDEYHWRIYDELIDRLESRELRVFATLQGTPAWATSGSQFSGVPDIPEDWRDFCFRVAARYRGRVHAWGFWNEPNLERFWEGSRSQYIHEILLPGADAVRAADPSALLAAPDLAHLISADWDDWLEAVIRNASEILDVITHHVYTSDGTSGEVTDTLHDGSPWPWDPPSVREILHDTGWRDRPFWLTETGVESDQVGESGQAWFYTTLLNDWFAPNRSYSWIDRIFFYEISDPPNQSELSWGILREAPGLERKLAFYAYRDFVVFSEVDDAEIMAPELPFFVGSQEVVEIAITVRNAGTTTWTADGDYGLFVELDQPGWEVEGGELEGDASIAPGETAVIDVVLSAPFNSPALPPRSATLFARMLREDRWFFGDAIHHGFSFTARQPAIIEIQPEDLRIPPHATAHFSVVVDSDTGTSFQWRRNSIHLEDGHRIVGAETPFLELREVGVDLLGAYDCLVTNSAGTVLTNAAALELVDRIRRPGERREPDPKLWQSWLEFRAR